MNKYSLTFQSNPIENGFFGYFKSQGVLTFVIIISTITPFNIYLAFVALTRGLNSLFVIRVASVVLYIFMIFLSRRNRHLFVVCSFTFQIIFACLVAFYTFDATMRSGIESFWLGFAVSQIHTLLKGINWISDATSYLIIFLIYLGNSIEYGKSVFMISSGIFILLNMFTTYKMAFFSRASYLSKIETLEQRKLWDFIMKDVFFGSMVLIKPFKSRVLSKVLYKSNGSLKLKAMRSEFDKVKKKYTYLSLF